jgi:hypothetical protein
MIPTWQNAERAASYTGPLGMSPPVYVTDDGRTIVIGPDGIHWAVTAAGWEPVLIPPHLIAGAYAGVDDLDDDLTDAEVLDEPDDEPEGDRRGGWLDLLLGLLVDALTDPDGEAEPARAAPVVDAELVE